MSYVPSAYTETICTLAELQLSNEPDSPIHCLTRGDSIGLSLIAEASCTSVLSILVVLGFIIKNYIHHLRYPPPGKWHLIQEPMDLYLLSLFLSDLIQGLGHVMDIKWVHTGKSENGMYCTAQGAIQQLGETSVAMITFVIAVHTFCAVWWGTTHSLRIACCIVVFIWLYVGLFVGVALGIHGTTGVTPLGVENTSYETPTPYWCWIDERHPKERIFGEYMWFWLTLATSLVLYIPLYFWSRGNITVNQEKWFDFKIHGSKHSSRDVPGGKRRSLHLLAYPLVYSAIILPLSVVRWITFNSKPLPSYATFIAVFIYGLGGCSNVLLFLLTRPGLLLFTPRAILRDNGIAPSPAQSRRGSGSHLMIEVHDPEKETPTGFGERPRPLGQLPGLEHSWDLNV